jgi:amidohydrolase
MHSGTFGGAIANPIQVLAELLVGCKDARSGKIKIPGFYDDVRRFPPRRRRAIAAAIESEAKFARELGAPCVFGERGYSTSERLGTRPTLEVNGIWGGYTGEGMKTVLPCEAHAKVSMRIVADQDPERIARIFAEDLRARAPAHARVEVRQLEHSGAPILFEPDFPAMKLAAGAVRRAFGREPLLVMDGASVPIVADFKRVLKRDTLLLGFGLPDDNLHAPNEKLDLRMFDKGIKTIAHLFEDLGRGTIGG